MALLAFPTSPSPDYPTERPTPKVNKTKFGDGYEQATGEGINGDKETTVSMTWTNVSDSEKDTINDFLLARKGYERFTYQTPGTATVRVWACEKWQVEYVHYNIWIVTAEFVRKFDVS